MLCGCMLANRLTGGPDGACVGHWPGTGRGKGEGSNEGGQFGKSAGVLP